MPEKINYLLEYYIDGHWVPAGIDTLDGLPGTIAMIRAEYGTDVPVRILDENAYTRLNEAQRWRVAHVG